MDGSFVGLLREYGVGGLGYALAGYFMWLVYSGRVIPRRTYLDQQKAAQRWEEAFRMQRDLSKQIIEPTAQVTRDVMRALPSIPISDGQPAPSTQSGPPPGAEPH